MQTASLVKKIITGFSTYIPGLLLTGTIAALSVWLGKLPFITSIGFGTLTLAIIIGIALGNTVYSSISEPCFAGVQFAKQRLLRLGIILYGFNLTFQQVLSVGLAAIIIDILIIASTFLLAYWLGKKALGIDSQTTILIGAGASICGAAAVMATEPIVKAESSKIAVAVSTVVIFGTLAMFLYPFLYQLNQHYQLVALDQSQFGIYLGSSVHEVAQVVAAGRTISENASDAAVITKMIRVMMLAPFLLVLSYYFSRLSISSPTNTEANVSSSVIVIPWFAVLFIAVAGFNSFHLLPQSWVDFLKLLDIVLLTMAMAALGLTTHISAVRQAGTKPLILAVILFGWLVIGGLIINITIQSIIN